MCVLDSLCLEAKKGEGGHNNIPNGGVSCQEGDRQSEGQKAQQHTVLHCFLIKEFYFKGNSI